MVEVAPAELAHEVLEDPAIVDSGEHLIRREAAEVQVGAEV
jgi:hypothetical protein